MGLGFTMYFPLENSGNYSKKNYEKYFSGLSSVVPEWNTAFSSSSEGFCVKLVPFEEEIYGDWELSTSPQGEVSRVESRLRVSAKTNSAGPGYHAYLIDIMDKLGIEPLEVEDETGYWENRDFGLLQEEMSEWLRGLGAQILKMSKTGEYKNIAVSLEIDNLPEDSNHLTCCPLGYFEKEFYEKTQSGSSNSKEFFIWWNREQDALFYRNCALNLIWCENNWLPPEMDDERMIAAATLGCLEKAYTMDTCLEYPEPEWLELALLTDDKALLNTIQKRFGAAKNAALGYRRGTICSNANGWRISHSGQMHFDTEDDGTLVWWDDDRTIRVSTLSFRWKEEIKPDSEALLKDAISNEEGCERFSLRDGQIAAAIQHTQIEENGEPLWQTRLTAALTDKLLILSIYYIDESDRNWAAEICASVTNSSSNSENNQQENEGD